MLHDLFRRALHDHRSAGISAFRPHIYNIIRRFDHVKIMFDHNDRIPAIRQSVKDLHQFVYIRKMQSCRRFVEHIDRLTGATPRQFGRQFDPLRLAAR